jgi:2-dehydro-3-deoxyphosphogluconate aldolase/(4S)-4-hydroxy-2-oxoglutarate aldolase
VVSPKFVKAVLGPMPQTLLMPSGGIPMDKKAITEWINSGAVAVNMGSALIKKELVKGERYSEISDNVARCLEWIKDAKASKRE